jgi:hypothetical protein
MTDIRSFGAKPDGTTDAASAINTGLIAGDILIQNGVFQIESPISIPSNRTIYIKNAKVRLKSNAHDNLFKNSDFNNGNVNINIIGQGHACLDGNSAGHDDSYATWGKATDDTYKYCLGVMVNVNGFEISGINCIDNAHWGIMFQGCTNGIFDSIHINCKNNIANQDLFDILWGCNNLTIGNITGSCQDDLFAVVGGNKPDIYVRTTSTPVGIRGQGDVHDITVNDLHLFLTSYHAVVFLGGDANKIYNIDFNRWRVDSCLFFTYFGLSGYYTVAPTKDEVYNITMDAITLNASADKCIKIFENCKDFTFTNITNNTGKTLVEVTAVDADNILINGTDYSV